jgi:hypothetical protein
MVTTKSPDRRTVLWLMVSGIAAGLLPTDTIATEPALSPSFEREFMALYEKLAPLERQFIRMQLAAPEGESLFNGEIKPAEFWDHYAAWRLGFPRWAIDKFETGEWTV